LDDQLCLFTLLYAPREQHERILADFVTPVASDLRDAPELHSLFFARYNVPSWQVRFRILGRPDRLDDLLGGQWPPRPEGLHDVAFSGRDL